MSNVRMFSKFSAIAALYTQACRNGLGHITIDVGGVEGYLSQRDVGTYIYGNEMEILKYPNHYKTDPLAALHSRTGSFTPKPNIFENSGFKSHQEIADESIVAAALRAKKFSPSKVSKR